MTGPAQFHARSQRTNALKKTHLRLDRIDSLMIDSRISAFALQAVALAYEAGRYSGDEPNPFMETEGLT